MEMRHFARIAARTCAAALVVGFAVGCTTEPHDAAERVGTRATSPRDPGAVGAGSEKTEDDRLAALVEERLNAETGTKGLEIGVVSDKGTVTLTGEVENDDQRKRIEALAQGVEGVKRVDSQLVVRAASKSSAG